MFHWTHERCQENHHKCFCMVPNIPYTQILKQLISVNYHRQMSLEDNSSVGFTPIGRQPVPLGSLQLHDMVWHENSISWATAALYFAL